MKVQQMNTSLIGWLQRTLWVDFPAIAYTVRQIRNAAKVTAQGKVK